MNKILLLFMALLFGLCSFAQLQQYGRFVNLEAQKALYSGAYYLITPTGTPGEFTFTNMKDPVTAKDGVNLRYLRLVGDTLVSMINAVESQIPTVPYYLIGTNADSVLQFDYNAGNYDLNFKLAAIDTLIVGVDTTYFYPDSAKVLTSIGNEMVLKLPNIDSLYINGEWRLPKDSINANDSIYFDTGWLKSGDTLKIDIPDLRVDTIFSSSTDTIRMFIVEFDTVYSILSRIDTVYSHVARVDTIYNQISRTDTIYNQISRVDTIYNQVARIDTIYNYITNTDSIFSFTRDTVVIESILKTENVITNNVFTNTHHTDSIFSFNTDTVVIIQPAKIDTVIVREIQTSVDTLYIDGRPFKVYWKKDQYGISDSLYNTENVGIGISSSFDGKLSVNAPSAVTTTLKLSKQGAGYLIKGNNNKFTVDTDGKIQSGELTWPIADSTGNSILITNGSGSIVFKNLYELLPPPQQFNLYDKIDKDWKVDGDTISTTARTAVYYDDWFGTQAQYDANTPKTYFGVSVYPQASTTKAYIKD